MYPPARILRSSYSACCSGGFEHIFVHPLGLHVPGIELVKFINNSVIPNVADEDEADFLEALMVRVLCVLRVLRVLPLMVAHGLRAVCKAPSRMRRPFERSAAARAVHVPFPRWTQMQRWRMGACMAGVVCSQPRL